jgi:hypothetical protein
LHLIQTPSVSVALNNFKFHFFINNTDDIDPEQPLINFEEFIHRVKEEAGDQCNRSSRSGSESLGQLMRFFTQSIVDEARTISRA